MARTYFDYIPVEEKTKKKLKKKKGNYTYSEYLNHIMGMVAIIILSISVLGTISIQDASALPSGIIKAIPITITNLQSTDVNNGTQLRIPITWNNYNAYLDSNLDNVLFFTDQNKNVTAWLENGTSNTATNSQVWIKMPYAIAHGNATIIYLGLYALGHNNLSPNGAWGENATISSTYGALDNGRLVFGLYDNFAGVTLNSTLWNQNSANLTVNNNLDYKNDHGQVISSTKSFTNPYIVEWYASGATNSNAGMYFDIQSSAPQSNGNVWVQRGTSSSGNDHFAWYNATSASDKGISNIAQTSAQNTLDAKKHMYSAHIGSSFTNPLTAKRDYTILKTFNNMTTGMFASGFLGPRNVINVDFNIAMIRERSPLPNDVMPTMSVQTSATAPSVPINVVATPGNKNITITWDNPLTNNGSPITNYAIWNSTSSGGEIKFTTIGNVNSYTLTGLNNGQVYYVQVSAINAAGESQRSIERTALPSSNTIPKGIISYVSVVITNQQLTQINTGTQVRFNINWNNYQSLLDANNDNVLFFVNKNQNVTAWMENGTSNTATNSIVWLKLPFNIPATSNAIIYMGFYNKGVNNFIGSGIKGSAVWGEAPQFSSTYGLYDNGASVFNFYDNFAGTSIDVTKWNRNNANYSINNQLTYTNNGGVKGNLQTVVTFTAPYVIDYYGKDTAGSDAGIFFNMQGTTPNSPTMLFSQRGGILVDHISKFNGVTTTSYFGSALNTLDSTFHQYSVVVGPSADNPLSIKRDYGLIVTTNAIGQTAYTSGHYGPRNVVNNNWIWQYTRERTVLPNDTQPIITLQSNSVPTPPQNLLAVPGNHNITLTWQPPTTNNGNPITNYYVWNGTSSGGEIVFVKLGNVTNYNMLGLRNGIAQFIKITAQSTAGNSTFSNEVSTIPNTSTPTAPQSLTIITSMANFTLNWNPPASNGGGIITGYKILRGYGSGFETTLNVIGNVTTYTDNAILNNTLYYYKVAALNDAGTGAKSNEVNGVIHSGNATQSFSLIFTQFPPQPETLAVHNLMLEYLTPTDYVQDRKSFNLFPNIQGILVADNFKAINSSIIAAPTYPLTVTSIAYDTENGGILLPNGTCLSVKCWPTPYNERANIVSAFNNASLYTHNAGFRFAYVPGAHFLQDAYPKVDWTKAELFWIQSGSNSNTEAIFTTNMTSMINTAKAGNPNIQIIIQLSATTMKDCSLFTCTNGVPAPADQLKQYEDEVTIAHNLGANGIAVVDVNDTKSPIFAIPNIEKLLSYINTYRGQSQSVPSAPINLNATLSGPLSVTLNWYYPASDGRLPITNYKIYRGQSLSSMTNIASVNNGFVPDLTYTDSNVAPQTGYYYQVSAVNSLGEGMLANANFGNVTNGRSAPNGTLTIETGNSVGNTACNNTQIYLYTVVGVASLMLFLFIFIQFGGVAQGLSIMPIIYSSVPSLILLALGSMAVTTISPQVVCPP